MSDHLFLSTYPQGAVVRAMLLVLVKYNLNRLQYLYINIFVCFVNFIHHKPPRTTSIYLTRHLEPLTRHLGQCHAATVISVIILLAQCIIRRFLTICHHKYVHLSKRKMYMGYQSPCVTIVPLLCGWA